MQSYVHVYTGNGKGKTTAALGLAIRALGAGKRVLFMQFMKTSAYSEHKIMAQLAPLLTTTAVGKPFFIAFTDTLSPAECEKWQDNVVVFPPGQPPAEYLALIADGLDQAKHAVASGDYDLVVLDEINCALHFGLLEWPQLQSLIVGRAANTELVLTGRGATAQLIDLADLVTEMHEVKHYYSTQGVEARRGIEN